MTPNLFLATQTLFKPHKWFKHQPKSARPARTTEHWDAPVPGLYEYIPGRGWYLIATDKPQEPPTPTSPTDEASHDEKARADRVETIKMTQPVQVKYSKVLKKYMLAPDYDMRKRQGRFEESGKVTTAGFFQLDDGVAWVQCWDRQGAFIPGPYKLWCIDKETSHFRHMLKCDDPKYITSRQNSFESRHSHESRSTQYRSGPGSNRDGPSVPSTRANSVRGLASPPLSKPGSRMQSMSRPGSPKSPGIPLSEATTLLEASEREQLERGRSRIAREPVSTE